MPSPRRAEVALPLILSFTAGFVEAICYIGLFRTFTTFITGTLMVLVIDLVTGQGGAVNKALVFVTFAACTILWVTLMRVFPWPARWRAPAFLALEAVLIVVFTVAGMLLEPLERAGSLETLVASVAAVVAMSLHSTIFFVLLSRFAPSHFMTGNLTNFSVGLIDVIRSRRGEAAIAPATRAQATFKAWHFPAVISAFAGGVALGAATFTAWGFAVLVFAAGTIATAAVVSARVEARASA